MSKVTKSRWEQNEISPSKLQHYSDSGGSEIGPDKDVCVWRGAECGLSEEKIDLYCMSVAHLPRDTALSILQDYEYDVQKASNACSSIGVLPDLSPLEERILLSSNPLPNAYLGVGSSANEPVERRVQSLLPHVPISKLRDYFDKLGRDGLTTLRGRTNKRDLIVSPAASRLIRDQYITVDDDSPLYERPPKRVLRSSMGGSLKDAESIPRKIGKGCNLEIAMVGYNQRREDDFSPVEGRSSRSLPLRMASTAARRPSNSPALASTSQLQSSTTSAAETKSGAKAATCSTMPRLRRESSKLGIDMKWTAAEGGATRRRSAGAAMKTITGLEEKSVADDESLSRIAAGTDRFRHSGVNEKARRGISNSSPDLTRTGRCSSAAPMTNRSANLTSPQRNRDAERLHIAMVGWEELQQLQPTSISSSVDSEGFAIPSVPGRSPSWRSHRSSPVRFSPP